mmetsp:Transcript_21377/g.44914  ORF Transcript_21377/g.44914 Transcript_21377/m.44914 type:complete len:118 (-) Transcript_21377:35-388(-)
MRFDGLIARLSSLYLMRCKRDLGTSLIPCKAPQVRHSRGGIWGVPSIVVEFRVIEVPTITENVAMNVNCPFQPHSRVQDCERRIKAQSGIVHLKAEFEVDWRNKSKSQQPIFVNTLS